MSCCCGTGRRGIGAYPGPPFHLGFTPRWETDVKFDRSDPAGLRDPDCKSSYELFPSRPPTGCRDLKFGWAPLLGSYPGAKAGGLGDAAMTRGSANCGSTSS